MSEKTTALEHIKNIKFVRIEGLIEDLQYEVDELKRLLNDD